MIAIAVVLWSLVALMVLAAIYGAFIEARRLRVDHLTVNLPRLPKALAGLRIVHIGDTHFKKTRLYEGLYEQMFTAIEQADPDLIMISGDIASGHEYLPLAAERLARLKARYGVFAVPGNHDLNITMERWLQGATALTDLQQMKRLLANAGITLLHNEHAVVEIKGCRVLIAGVADASAQLDDIELTLRGAPEADLIIVLTHSPDIIDSPGIEVADLVLCGHTHGGQFMLPGIGPVWAPVWRDRRRGAGLLAFGDVVCHVTRGIGMTWPFRIGCPPQVAVLELQPGPPNGRKLKPELRHPARKTAQVNTGGNGR